MNVIIESYAFHRSQIKVENHESEGFYTRIFPAAWIYMHAMFLNEHHKCG